MDTMSPSSEEMFTNDKHSRNLRPVALHIDFFFLVHILTFRLKSFCLKVVSEPSAFLVPSGHFSIIFLAHLQHVTLFPQAWLKTPGDWMSGVFRSLPQWHTGIACGLELNQCSYHRPGSVTCFPLWGWEDSESIKNQSFPQPRGGGSAHSQGVHLPVAATPEHCRCVSSD